MQRLLLCLCLIFAIELPCRAQGDKAGPNTLTPKEIADGWLLLFDGESPFGWTAFGNDRTPKVANGFLDLNARAAIASTTFAAFELQFQYQSGSKALAFVGMQNHKGLSTISLPNQTAWTQVVFRVGDGEMRMTVQGKTISEEWVGAGSVHLDDLQVRNIKLRPLNTKSIFNAKDLTGWKTFPGDKYKSKFSVNDKGELNVKDGPGDLQTAGKYKDFVLQLECISNGKHLNSGIFFRCRDNEYQNGYEAQIRNQFTEKPMQKYVVEEYDPKTNMLFAKKDVMSTAFDYGTGAIYRRVPARKEMSKDNEWFAMTIVAHGNHLATWVNGVQVADWYDHRPKSDNARIGCKLDAGHISIQGHDPTTDLSFKNFRITELK